MGYRNVVVGTDGSETAAAAVRHAAELAKAFGARLTVVTAHSQSPGSGGADDPATCPTICAGWSPTWPAPRSGPGRARQWLQKWD